MQHPPTQLMFRLLTAVAVLSSLGFAAYLYASYAAILTGSEEASSTAPLLSNFNAHRYNEALGRMERRQKAPDAPENLRNPFGVDDGGPIELQ